MILEGNVREIGNSLWISIPARVAKDLLATPGDKVRFDLLKVIKIKTIRCPDCRTFFNDEEKYLYDCPMCGKEIHESEVKDENSD